MSFLTSLFNTAASAVNTPIVLRGRLGGEDLIIADQSTAIDLPLAMFGFLTLMLMTGAIFVALEMRLEALDRKA